MMEQEGKGYQGIRAIKAFEYENTRSYFDIVITVKNEKQCLTKGIPWTHGAFLDKFTPNIDGYTDETVVQHGVQVVGNT